MGSSVQTTTTIIEQVSTRYVSALSTTSQVFRDGPIATVPTEVQTPVTGVEQAPSDKSKQKTGLPSLSLHKYGKGPSKRDFFDHFPWEHADEEGDSVYHTRARLEAENEEALLVDPGAYDNLCGGAWAERQSRLSEAADGRKTAYRPLSKILRVQGVGKSSQQTSKAAKVPGVLDDGTTMFYEAPCIEDWPGPALLGLRSLEKHQAILDCRSGHRKLYLGKEARVVGATQAHQLEMAMSGHLMLPISRFSKASSSSAAINLHSSHDDPEATKRSEAEEATTRSTPAHKTPTQRQYQ